jgi:hypothetical protein
VEKEKQVPSPRSEFNGSPSLEELAAQQGVAPIDDFDSLLGKPSPGDESPDEFLTMLREWRREGGRPERLP